MKPRVDGLPKVTGSKLYATDLRPADMEGWPSNCSYAWLLRAPYADRPFEGLDQAAISALDRNLLFPSKVVTAADLFDAGLASPLGKRHPKDPSQANTAPGFFGLYWLVPPGAVPDHIGQPVAIWFYPSQQHVRDAGDWFRATGGCAASGQQVMRFGQPRGQVEEDIRRISNPLLGVRALAEEARYGTTHMIRESIDLATDRFSAVLNGPHDPDSTGPSAKPAARPTNIAAREARNRILAALSDEGLKTMQRTFYTQCTDPMFMEPEAGLGWFQRDGRQMHLVIGTQSPRKDREAVQVLLGRDTPDDLNIGVNLVSCYPGGGFGGRDASAFVVYAALAAFFSEQPVRLAFDRYEQFTAGIKRHAATLDTTVAYRADTGELHTLVSDILMDGGGQANLTMPVVELCALHAGGPYRWRHNIIRSSGVSTNAAPSGSMRGFGIPQAAFAIESMVDEIAQTLGRDPINYRLAHVLKSGDRDLLGMPLANHLDTATVCSLAAAEPLWRERAEAKRARDGINLRYGVGFACCMEAIGTSQDAVFAEVRVHPDGTVSVNSTAVDMGQGSATAIANATEPLLGVTASRVALGVISRFDLLGLTTAKAKDDPAPYANPRYTPKIDNTMSASVTALHHLHAVHEACRVVWDHGLVPAAAAIWGAAPADTRWQDGVLVADGHRPLTLSELAKGLHAAGLPAGAAVHTYFKESFTRATFTIDTVARERHIDALAIVRGAAVDDRLEFITREHVVAPDSERVKNFKRSLYASVGHLVAVTVSMTSGEVRVANVVTILDVGDVHNRALVEGQVEGGVAMGLGMALLEELPPAPTGVDGTWNLNKYFVPRASHMPLGRMELRLVPLPPDVSILKDGPKLRKKGIAEAVITTIPAAVANAVAHATGARINALPLSPQRVLRALS